MAEQWMKWTLLEACTRTSSKMFQKKIGGVGKSFNHALFATFVVGLVQVIGGYAMAKVKKKKIFVDARSIIGSCWFGFNACICTVIPFYIFVLDGDVGTNTFIVTLSIVPGALIDRLLFQHQLNSIEWVGVFTAILAGYSFLGLPTLPQIINLPLWVWLSFLVMMLVAINQGITQKIKEIDPFVKNFWGGLTTFLFAFIGLIFFNALDLVVDFSMPMKNLWLYSLLIGVVVICLWSFNLMSYKGGAHIAIKKLVMNGTFLTLSMVGGIIFYDEQLTYEKVIGVILYFIAFCLMDKKTREYFLNTFT